jgi:hypothetical protein
MSETTEETVLEGSPSIDPQDANNQPDPEVDVEGLMGDSHKEGGEPEPEAEQDGETEGRPEGIPEKFWDNKKGEIRSEALAKSYDDLRKEFNKLKGGKGKDPKAPENAEDYLAEFETPKEIETEDGVKALDRVRDIPSDDPALIAFSESAKKYGLSKEQFNGIIMDVLAGANDQLPEPFDREAEMSALGGEEKALPFIKTNQNYLLHLHKNGVLNEGEYKYALAFGTTAVGVQTLNKLRINSGEKPIPVGATATTGAKTPDECAAMLANPLYNEDTPAGEAYRAKVEAEFKRTHGE